MKCRTSKMYYFWSALVFFCILNLALAQQYQANWSSLDARPLPLWYDEAKFGIFCHWGVFSVPAYDNEWFWWYWQGKNYSYIAKFMSTHYPPKTTYADFARDFTAIDFDANQFAGIIKSSGAKYFVQTSKHHEGYTLWPSAVSWNWNAVDVGPARDLLGELRQAILKVGGIHWGTYFSQFEWFNRMYLNDKKNNASNYVNGVSYPQMVDLVTNYQPDVIWSDGDWEMSSEYWRAQEFLAWLYNDSPVKDTVVVNDRWGAGAVCHHGGYYTCQDRFLPGTLQQHKWEDADTLDKRSWGYRRDMVNGEVLTVNEVITRLVTVISTGGNYLLNIGPDQNGRVLPIFEERLNQIGQFVNTHADAIFATKPWIFQNDSGPTWYTSKLRDTTGFDPYRLYNPQQQNNTIIYAFVVAWPDDNLVNLTHIIPTAQTTVNLFSFNNQTINLPYTQPLNGGILVNISSVPIPKFPSSDAFVFKIEYAADQCPMNFIKSNTNSKACYSFINETLDWVSANAACAKAAPGATLVSIGSAFENSEVDGLVKGSNNAYIGLHYQNNNWVWVNGDTSAYRNWKNGFPTNDATNSCAAMDQNDGKWTNQNCSIQSTYICKASI